MAFPLTDHRGIPHYGGPSAISGTRVHSRLAPTEAGKLGTMVPLKVTYDEVANAAYIYFQAPGTQVAMMYPCDPVDVSGMINLDFDASGRLIGLEVLDARAKLAPELLMAAEIITRRTADGQ